VIIASLNGAFLGSFILMRQHVCLQVLKNLSAFLICASSLLF
jgi:hypothetical protein